MAYLYILQSLVNSRYYIGSTEDWKRRLGEHNQGKSRYTRLTKPFRIVFLKSYSTLKEAHGIELELKKLKSRKIIERIIEEQKINIG